MYRCASGSRSRPPRRAGWRSPRSRSSGRALSTRSRSPSWRRRRRSPRARSTTTSGASSGCTRFVREDVERRLLDRMEGAVAASGPESDRSAAVTAALLVGLDFAVREGFLRILGEPPAGTEHDRAGRDAQRERRPGVTASRPGRSRRPGVRPWQRSPKVRSRSTPARHRGSKAPPARQRMNGSARARFRPTRSYTLNCDCPTKAGRPQCQVTALAAAGVVAAARARVARARALHHAAALGARRAEVEAGHAGRDDRRACR